MVDMTVRYVLSLPEAFERREKIKKQFDLLGLDFNIIDAKRFTEDEIKDLITKGWRDVFKIGVGAVGCFCSHVEAWRKIANGSHRGGFVFEDDAFFSPDAFEFFVDDKWIPEGVDVCQLSHWPSEKHPTGRMFRVLGKMKLNKYGYELIKIYSPCPWGTQAYWISREASKKTLLMLETKFENPVDFFLFSKDSNFWKKNKVYSLTPAVVTELLGNASQRVSIDLSANASQCESVEDGSHRIKARRNFEKLLDKIVHLFCVKKYHGFK